LAAHSGEIHYESADGGTIFRIQIPMAFDGKEKSIPSPSQPANQKPKSEGKNGIAGKAARGVSASLGTGADGAGG
jgi:hypothetical protein